MQYRVIPFVARISSASGSSDVASQLETLIAGEGANGWEYMQLEQVSTHVMGNSGCFGFGATPGHETSYSVVVFRK